MSEPTSIETQYKLAIQARDNLNDNYHKWMNFYYVANGAILVAVTAIFKEAISDKAVFFLALVGILISLFWYLACKGYQYWSNSWIDIIINLEKKLVGEDGPVLVYSAFSKKVAAAERYVWIPLKPANISTPKLTLLFSFFSIVGWTTFAIIKFMSVFLFCCDCFKMTFAILLPILVIVGLLQLPLCVKSREEGSHTLI